MAKSPSGRIEFNDNEGIPFGVATIEELRNLTVDNIAVQRQIDSSVFWKRPVDFATIGNLPGSYGNGENWDGVGAIIFGGGWGRLYVDYQLVPLESTVLVKNQTNPEHNGVYILTTEGSSTTSWILTRDVGFDTNEKLQQSITFAVLYGSINKGTVWIQKNKLPYRLGFVDIEFTRFINRTDWYFYDSKVNITAPVYIQDVGNFRQMGYQYAYFAASPDIKAAVTGIGNDITARYGLLSELRIGAAEFNAFSSIKKKTILANSKDVELEVLEIFKKIPLFKYEFKDKLRDGNATCYGVIAEYLNDILPDFVDNNCYDFVYDIAKPVKLIKKENLIYRLNLKNIDKTAKKIRFITPDKVHDLEIVQLTKTYADVQALEELNGDIFAYGTYSICPTVAKQKLFEILMVVAQNNLRRTESLEQENTDFKKLVQDLTKRVVALENRNAA